MKKTVVTALIALSVFLLQGCTSSVINEYDDFSNRGYVILGLDDTFAPMGFRNEKNELVGFDIDLANAVFDYLELEVRFQPIDWNSKELELKSGRIDMIWNGLSITEARKENMLFSNAYLANNQIMMKRINDSIDAIADLDNKNVGVQISSAADDVLSQNPIIDSLKSVVKYDTYTQALLELDSMTIDVVIMDEIMARYIISQKVNTYEVATESFSSELYGIGLRLESTELRDKINEALAYLETSGVTKTISEKWFNEDIFYSNK